MADIDDRRGILYPSRLPTLYRESSPAHLRELVRWFWIPRWQLAPGRTSRQHLLPFPASNLVVGPDDVFLAGPVTGAAHRDLSGTGWAVGALLRPAAVPTLIPDPRRICDDEITVDMPELHEAVASAMTDSNEPTSIRNAVRAFTAWAAARLPPPDQDGLLTNRMEDLIATDRSILRVDQVADHLDLSTRGVQRLARRYVGVPPLAMIRRYRLQEAAQRLRENPSASVADIANELGYADHAHLCADFRRVLGFTPRSYQHSSDRDVRKSSRSAVK